MIAEGDGLHCEAGPARPGGGEAALADADLLPGGHGGRGGGLGGQAGAAAFHGKTSSHMFGNFEPGEMSGHTYSGLFALIKEQIYLFPVSFIIFLITDWQFSTFGHFI